ncbi:ribonuclease HII [Carnobacteriaceae bacterium zg-ZUI78]|nr:ribonuclease HII [Carnobacteriaceae bacterium zg-ZUI78]
MTKWTTSQIKDALNSIQHKQDIPVEWYQDERKSVQQALKSWEDKLVKFKKLQEKLDSMLSFEKALTKNGYNAIAGIDEVGRGPLAGPVVAACVMMPMDTFILSVNDSKQLSEKKREKLYKEIMANAISVGIGIVEPNDIDTLNIYQATKVAMQQAVDKMSIKPDFLLIDAMTLTNDLPQESLIKGDARSYSIACASIIAKVTRDRMMCEYAQHYPHYAFDKNAGYGTKDHLLGLEKYGITPIHRKSFEPIKTMLNNNFHQ